MVKSPPAIDRQLERVLRVASDQMAVSGFRDFEPFLRNYFRYTDPNVLAALSPEQAVAIAHAHWQTAQLRQAGKPVVRVYNAADGLGARTVIEIVTDNMPFLVDSVRMELNRCGCIIHLAVHPVCEVERDADGRLLKAEAPQGHGARHKSPRESFMHMQVDRILEPEKLDELQKNLISVLADVRSAVNDWQKIRKRLHALVDSLPAQTAVSQNQTAEACEFLQWLDQQNFTFLGFQHYEVRRSEERVSFVPTPRSALGLMRSKSFSVEDYAAEALQETRKRRQKPRLLLITKSVQRATVHRPGYLDYIIVRHFDRGGEIVAESRFIGLFSSNAYRRHPREVPVIQQKIHSIFRQSGFDPVSHIGKAFEHILETYPRDELFQADETELFSAAQSILYLSDRQRLKLFVRNDKLRRFITCLIYVPRDHYDTEIRLRMSAVIQQQLSAQSLDFNVRLTDDSFARVEFFIRTDPEHFPQYDADQLERLLEQVSRSWNDDLKQELLARLPEHECVASLTLFQNAFPVAYQQDFTVAQAFDDIRYLQRLSEDNHLAVNLYQSDNDGGLRLKLYKLGESMAPSDSLPILENMGVRVLQERPYRIQSSAAEVWIHDHGLECKVQSTTFDQFKSDFEEIFAAAWFKRVESDGFNALGLLASLSSREIKLLRAYCKYLLQAGLTFSQAYMEQCLNRYSAIAAEMIALFKQRFDPAMQGEDSEHRQKQLEDKISAALNDVASLDDDRILRNYLGLVMATVRTNYYQAGKDYISFKFDTAKVPELPQPRPMFEIFVYSVRTEGVHLRAGKVARGGLRWSDRREDFRTEILGLVKAQKVKNAVIVPTGAKGGFVVKRPPPPGDREAFLNEGIDCYRQFVSGLLDLTDNVDGDKLIAPADTVRYDADDSYLVVAADKGTAAFSDIANSVAESYRFWLGDAFASGGSKGYDHKKMGITAKGAWESVKLLFRDLGKNIQKEPFTVIGIGDMAGDVFGNGMLLSKQIKLVGAFNHMHIFLDPDPDPAASFKERQRLFRLPRSSWADYNAELISKGGGVFARSAKSISLSKPVQNLLGVQKSSMTPNELIHSLLQAPADLLWNGGIGTYVKASHETHAAVGDRSNDALRVDARELHCKVIGEGGNLGLTQAARVEFALNGGLLDSDFVHNAGGVNCSDHEVNIKILLYRAMAAGRLNENQRVKLLEQMTDEVAELVLLSNYWQGQAITLIESEAPRLLEEHSRYMRKLESAGQLHRKLEGLPDDEQLIERKGLGKGLTRPEIGVLVSYSKIIAEHELTDSELWDDPYFAGRLLHYFPQPLRQRFADLIHQHPLRREILATFIVNRMINRMGCTYLYRVQEETGASFADITRSYTIAWEVFGLRQIWTEIAALDNQVAAEAQISMMLEVVRLIDRAGRWLLRNRKRLFPVDAIIDEYRQGAEVLLRKLPHMVEISQDPIIRGALQYYTDQGVSAEMARKIVAMDALYCTFDVTDIGRQTQWPVEAVCDTYFSLSAYLDVYWLRIKMRDYKPETHWQELARKSQLVDLYRVLGELTREVLRVSEQRDEPLQRIEKWCGQNTAAVERCLRIPQELRAIEHVDMAMFAVALRELQNLHQASSASQ